MNQQYNLYNLEASFKNYLNAGIEKTRINTNFKRKKRLTRISIKNYLSDLRHFLGWLTFKIQSNPSLQQSISTSFDQSQFISIINTNIILNYKSYLIENNIPTKTINRRLSTLRKFCSFCISQGWIKENPAKKVSNINLTKKSTSTYPQNKIDSDILQQFHQDLIKENLDRSTIKSYLDDVREFFSI